ncbi:DUF6152 family protein [Propylenella binzhouense]|uniref:Uncharacterized protein n=1 Tax=Propylenella binzhouense TaxID=2555902 RepID=A0A964WUD7_9HYPH|nr:DUF6152 family protein [Propylenella binzhouense]MYZ49012.1 hypothetical protein [Propylenella binzhouense]
MLNRRAVLASLGLALAGPGRAFAHHGWGWTEEDAVFVLEGTIAAIYLGNPHATLEVDAADGRWHVDLAPPIRTRRAGFDEEAAAVGDPVKLTGHRASDHADRRMKAIRVEVRGKAYDVYPDRAHAI